MKIGMLAPKWNLPWMELLPRIIRERGHELVTSGPMDVCLHMWAKGQPIPEAKVNIFWMRRYELFEPEWASIDWGKVDALIFVNDWIKGVVDGYFQEQGIKTPTQVIYNCVDPSAWTYRERGPGHKIGMACHVHPKKNLPLAAQILAALPPEYELHIAGDVQDPCTAAYLAHFAKAVNREIYLYGHVPREDLDAWWEDKSYCLSTSVSEGCPNNVLEAMAKGIMPVVHEWPGAYEQFYPWTFTRAAGACIQMAQPYDSSAYRSLAERRFSLQNLHRVIDLAEALHANA